MDDITKRYRISKKKRYIFIFSTVGFIVLAFFVFISFSYRHSNDILKGTDLKDLGGIKMGTSYKQFGYTAYTVLTTEFNQPLSLIFQTAHTRFIVKLDKQIIYEFGYDDGISFLKSPGSAWHIVNLPAGSSAKKLEIEFDTPYRNYIGYMPDIRYGTEGECMAAYQSSAIFSLYTIFTVSIGGIIAIIIYYIIYRKEKTDIANFFNIGVFAFIVSLWMLFQSGSVQLVMGYPQLWYFVDLISLIVFPIPLNMLLYHMAISDKKKGFLYFNYAYISLLLINLILQATAVFDMFELVMYTHGLMVINIVYFTFVLYGELKNHENRNLKNFVPPLLILFFGGTVEIVTYYMNSKMYTSGIFRFSVMIFLFWVIADALSRYYKTVLELRHTEYIQMLANIDLLTGLSSRNVYEEDLSTSITGEAFTAVILDLNLLKYINDNYGHSAGDDALKIVALSIKQVFSQKGECYRIGGDEFAVLIYANDRLENESEAFERVICQNAKEKQYRISVAYGIASFDESLDNNIYDTVIRADREMYLMKKDQKRDLEQYFKADPAFMC